MKHGFSLVELVIVVALLLLATSVGIPVSHRVRDAAAVHGAVSGLLALVTEARIVAVARGGAEVHLSDSPPSATIVVGGTTLRSAQFEPADRLVLRLPRGRPRWTLRYDALGIGRIASSTLTVQAGEVSRRLVVSSYGRLRRP